MVGFTVGIAITIAMSNIGAVLGVPVEKGDAVHEIVDEEGEAGDLPWSSIRSFIAVSKINPVYRRDWHWNVSFNGNSYCEFRSSYLAH